MHLKLAWLLVFVYTIFIFVWKWRKNIIRSLCTTHLYFPHWRRINRGVIEQIYIESEVALCKITQLFGEHKVTYFWRGFSFYRDPLQFQVKSVICWFCAGLQFPRTSQLNQKMEGGFLYQFNLRVKFSLSHFVGFYGPNKTACWFLWLY